MMTRRLRGLGLPQMRADRLESVRRPEGDLVEVVQDKLSTCS